MAGRIAGQGSNWIRRDARWAIYLRDGCACVYCGAAQEDGVTLTLDHVLACNLGGDNSPSNLVSACGSCNSSKQALTMADWYLVLRDQGVDTTVLGARIRALTSTDIAAYRTVAKKILADRVAQHGA